MGRELLLVDRVPFGVDRVGEVDAERELLVDRVLFDPDHVGEVTP
jgi:hypothetical protein